MITGISGVCGCMGCVNHTILNNNYTKEDWLEWVEQHPYSKDDWNQWLSEFLGTKIESQELQINENYTKITPTSILTLTDPEITICEHTPNNPVRLFINSTEFRNALKSNIGNSDYDPTLTLGECIDNIIAECNALRK